MNQFMNAIRVWDESLCSITYLWSRLFLLRGILVALFMTITVLAPPPQALAAPSTKELAKSAFKRGRVAFDQERYPEALQAFEEAYQHFPLPLMLYNIANVYERLKLYPQAIKHYKAFVKTGKDVNGEAADKLERLETKTKDWVEVTFMSDPAGAQVRLFTEQHPPLGETPLRQPLPATDNLIVYVTVPGGKTIKKSVLISSGLKRQTINIKLPKPVAYVRVIGSPEKARVSSGEQSAQSLPALLKLSAGDHELSITASGYLPSKRIVTLRSVHSQNAPLTLEVNLKNSEGVGLISLDVSVAGALLFIDGLPKGQSPFNDPIELSEGEHLIELKGPQGGQYQETIQLKAGETTQLNVDFASVKPWLSRDQLTLGLLSLGGTSLLTGLVLGGIALNASGNLEDCRTHELCARRQGELDRAQALRAYATSADIFTVLGLLVGGAGGTLYWLDHREANKPTLTPSMKIQTLTGGAGLSTELTF